MCQTQRCVLCDDDPSRIDIGKHLVRELQWDSRFSLQFDERTNCDLAENNINNSIDANTSDSHDINIRFWNNDSKSVSDNWNVFVILERMSTARFLRILGATEPAQKSRIFPTIFRVAEVRKDSISSLNEARLSLTMHCLSGFCALVVGFSKADLLVY